MNWIALTDLEQIQVLTEQSHTAPALIFKHSIRCATSTTVLSRIERNWNDDEMGKVKTYFLDLISYRQVSNAVADKFGIEHESPQVILIQNGLPGGNWSHLDISYQAILASVEKEFTS